MPSNKALNRTTPNDIDYLFALCEDNNMTPKTWRKQQKLTLEQLSRMIGFSTGHICEIESGKKNGSTKLFNAYYRASGGLVTPNDFFHSYEDRIGNEISD